MKRHLKKLPIIIAVAWLLTLSTSTWAAAVTDSRRAMLQVSQYHSFLITDFGDMGLRFGSVVPGSVDKAEVSQVNTGSLMLQVAGETNVDVIIMTRMDDFISGSNIMPAANAKWNTVNNTATSTPFATGYENIAELTRGDTVMLWHWLSVGSDQAPGSYTTTVYYQSEAIPVKQP